MKMVKAIRKQAGAAECAAISATDPSVAAEMKRWLSRSALKLTP
jgi:hypothetical protein